MAPVRRRPLVGRWLFAVDTRRVLRQRPRRGLQAAVRHLAVRQVLAESRLAGRSRVGQREARVHRGEVHRGTVR